mmetsp:Transcript_26926/g.53792  ORF Transcript_26926/g.53792 Transcript_26926/m.53792 type:complete len:133 (-) Transcript_26926:484-882(-)
MADSTSTKHVNCSEIQKEETSIKSKEEFSELECKELCHHLCSALFLLPTECFYLEICLFPGFTLVRECNNGKRACVTLNNTNNNSENSESRCKNFNDEDFYEKRSILGITNGTCRSCNSDRNSGRNICETNT